jgi:ferredoxin-NADP reductase
MMGSMGEMMGGAPRKQLYPQLMEVPTLTGEARQRVEGEAHNRINAGNALLAEAQKEFHSAMIAGDSAAMFRAAARQREAVAQMESGAAVLQALAEGKPPQQIALTWFRDQLSLTPQQAPTEAPTGMGPLGLTWFHLITMATILSFVVAMLGLNVAQRRRARALIDRLTSVPSASVGKLAVPPATPVAQPVPAAQPAPGLPAAALSQPKAAEPPAQAIQAPRPKPWSGKLRVAAIHRETPHVKTFRLVNPSGERIPFTYSPGQFLTFSAEVDGKTVRRSYSISSPPTRVAYVEITVKREENGIFSDYLHDKVTVDDLLATSGPAGVFTFDGAGAESVVLIAGGVGITPLMCVLRYLLDLAWRGDLYLLFAAGTTEEFIFREELEYLQKRHRNLHVVAAMASRAEGTAWMGLEGRLTKNVIAQVVPQGSNQDGSVRASNGRRPAPASFASTSTADHRRRRLAPHRACAAGGRRRCGRAGDRVDQVHPLGQDHPPATRQDGPRGRRVDRRADRLLVPRGNLRHLQDQAARGHGVHGSPRRADGRGKGRRLDPGLPGQVPWQRDG